MIVRSYPCESRSSPRPYASKSPTPPSWAFYFVRRMTASVEATHMLADRRAKGFPSHGRGQTFAIVAHGGEQGGLGGDFPQQVPQRQGRRQLHTETVHPVPAKVLGAGIHGVHNGSPHRERLDID